RHSAKSSLRHWLSRLHTRKASRYTEVARLHTGESSLHKPQSSLRKPQSILHKPQSSLRKSNSSLRGIYHVFLEICNVFKTKTSQHKRLHIWPFFLRFKLTNNIDFLLPINRFNNTF